MGQVVQAEGIARTLKNDFHFQVDDFFFYYNSHFGPAKYVIANKLYEYKGVVATADGDYVGLVNANDSTDYAYFKKVTFDLPVFLDVDYHQRHAELESNEDVRHELFKLVETEGFIHGDIFHFYNINFQYLGSKPHHITLGVLNEHLRTIDEWDIVRP